MGVGEMVKVEREAWNSWMLSATAPEGQWGLEVRLQVSNWSMIWKFPRCRREESLCQDHHEVTLNCLIRTHITH